MKTFLEKLAKFFKKTFSKADCRVRSVVKDSTCGKGSVFISLTEPIQFVEESRSALQAVRRALIDLYEAIGANPETPQDVARKYNINRNLTWKLSRVIGAQDPFAALNHLPGQPGIELSIGAFEKAGAPTAAVGNLRTAMNSLLRNQPRMPGMGTG